MARIAGVDLPREKRVEIGITYIYGIGLATAKKILKETGVTLGKYIDDMVFIKAQELLLNNQLSIATISTFLGFCDQFYFSRWFKSMHGETPSHFRKSFL